MQAWKSGGNGFLFLKIINCVLIVFWIVYFSDAFLPVRNSIETIRNFEEFTLIVRGRSGKVPYKKLITEKRHFTTYANENDFFISDTLELKLTPIFGLVRQYRGFVPDHSNQWITSNYSPYRRWTTLVLTIGLLLLTLYSVLVIPNIKDLKVASLFTIMGAVIFVLSTLI